jgi:hypothetical protein
MIKKLVPSALLTLDGAWNVTFQPGRGAPASTVLPKLQPLSRKCRRRHRAFLRRGHLCQGFRRAQGWKPGQPLWINLGDLREVAGQRQRQGCRHGLAHALSGGLVGRGEGWQNHIEVRVANLWINRLIGDKQPGAKPVTFTTMPIAPMRRCVRRV